MKRGIKKATEKVAPCPYCADPTLLDPPKGKRGEETYPVPNSGGRFWRKSGPPSILHAYSYGKRWVAEVPPGYFGKSFEGFKARSVGVEIGFFVLGQPPAPFSNHILTHLRKRLPLVPSPARGSLPTVAYVLFSGVVIEHEGEGVEVRAHWWPSHGWIINQRVTLTASDPAERNAQLEHAYTALDFFLLETRGAPKITTAQVKEALSELGGAATQRDVAAKLGVTEQGLDKWRGKQGYDSWHELVAQMIPD